MAIKRYTATLDNTITNAFEVDLSTRATGSNMGAADTLEVFSLYGQASGTDGLSVELSRAMVKFPVSQMQTDRSSSVVPRSGSVSWFLRLFNARHSEPTPRKYVMAVSALERDWHEGSGLDMESYTDKGYPLGSGSNWIYANKQEKWQQTGGDFDPLDASGTYTQYFDSGDEDLEVDITPLVETWMNDEGNVLSSRQNHGLIVYLSGTYEGFFSASSKDVYAAEFSGLQRNTGSEGELIHNPNGAKRSYYTKKFFARSSEYFFKRPVIEGRWNSSIKDDRGNFYYSSSLAPAEDNLNTLYLYNYVRGQLKNIPILEKRDNKIFVTIYSASNPDGTSPSGVDGIKLPKGGGVVTALDFNATGGLVPGETGIYSCSFALTASETPLAKVFDVWHAADGDGPHGTGSESGNGATQFFTGSIVPKTLNASAVNPSTTFYSAITNLRPVYYTEETARFRIYARPRNWNPNIYTKASPDLETNLIESGAYQISRISDNYTVINYGTSSTTIPGRGELHTQMSFDASGNYFDLDMSMLEPGYSYAVRLAYYNGAIKSWVQQDQYFKFRVEKSAEFYK